MGTDSHLLHIVGVCVNRIGKEHSTDAAVTPKNYREAFRAGGAIPHYFRIYVASHSTNHDVAMRRYSHCVAFGSQKPNPPLDGVPNNIQSITFYMGRVFVHVNAARVAGFEIERFVIAPTLYENFRIWPLKHYEIVWPKEPRFTVEGVSQITFAQENLINAHKVNWVRDHPTESKTI